MNNIKAVIRIIKQLDYILTKKQKKSSIIVFFSMLLGAALDLLGISVVYPFLQLVMDERAIRTEWYTRWIFVLFPNIGFSQVLIIFCLIIILIYLVKNAVALGLVYIQARFAARFKRELSTRIVESIMTRPYEFFIINNGESVRQRIHGDTEGAYAILSNLLIFASNSISVALIGAFLLYNDWLIAILALALSLSCFLIIVLVFKKRLKEYGKRSIKYADEQSRISHEAIYGIKEVIVMNRKAYFIKKFDDISRKIERIATINTFLAACPNRILEGICVGGFIGIAGVRIALGDNPEVFIPTLGVFVMGVFKILPTIGNMSGQINGMVFNQERLNRCYQTLSESETTEGNGKVVLQPSKTNICEAGEVCVLQKEIVIDNISWKYNGSSSFVLKDLNMTIKKGESVALVGSSGAGKTTLGDVLLGLFKPKSGNIYMDGVDIYSMPIDWYKIVGYVPQSIYMTDDTLRANVAFGLEDDEIEDEKVWMALEQAQLAEYTRSLPQGLDTRVGESGVRFSGGQRQRVAIARALYNNPEILVLDEATSALDAETESAVMESIDALLGRKTMIIIAHRLTTIRNCDAVYEIRDGKAVLRNREEILLESGIK